MTLLLVQNIILPSDLLFRLPTKTKTCQLKNSTLYTHRKSMLFKITSSPQKKGGRNLLRDQEEAEEEAVEHPLQALSVPHEGAFFVESVLVPVVLVLFSTALLAALP
jgi:hypothetical protein